MFRRSRFSIRPNVGVTGRAAAAALTNQAPSSNQESSETPKDTNEDRVPAAGTDQSVVTPSEKTTAEGDVNDQNAEGVNSSAAVQRRKRFSIKPKVAPGRPSALARTSKPPTKAPAAAETPPTGLNEPPTSNTQTKTTAMPQGLQSLRRRRLSEESKRPEPTLVPSGSPESSGFHLPEDSQAVLPTDEGKRLENKSGSQVKEAPPKQFDKVPQPFKPDRESIELSEKAKTLVSSKTGLSMSPSAFSLCRLLNDTSDIQRLAKAQKLRALLREETHKVKKMKKIRAHVKEFTIDPTKMTMGDLIHYLPLSNPMTSSIATGAEENETIIPPSPTREHTPERTPEPEKPLKTTTPRNDDDEEPEEEEEEELMVPQVKVAEDGTLIIDEESLTVEVQRAKGPNPADDRDPIFERGSTTTYTSFRKLVHTKPWFSEETDMFFLAISMVGTDFSMICQLFPHRTRSEIKNKFKKEERENSWRIDKAFKEKRKLDIEYFSKLLEKILEFHKNKKKLRSLSKKNAPKKPRKKKSKGKKAAKKLSDVDEEDEEDVTEMPDLHDDDDDGEEEEEEGEKENEDLCNEGGAAVSKPKRQRKRKMAAVNEDSDCKKKKKGEKSGTQGEACATDDTEEAPPATSDMSKKTEDVNAAKDTTIKPAKLSRGRAPASLLPLGRKWGKKGAPSSTKAKDAASENMEEPASDGAAPEQANQNSSPLKEANKNKLHNADEEDEVAPSPKPTRYGRIPKPTKPLNYPAKDDSHAPGSDATISSPAKPSAAKPRPKPKCTAKRERPSKQESSRESKKPKLVTLRACRSEFSDDDEDDETQHDQERRDVEEDIEEGEEHPACSPSQDSLAPVFVPASLRSPPAVISEVEETMEELDILANMPDVLGISQDALYRETSCELTQNDSGTAEPCEHQLDLLVDVIDLLSAEHPEVTDEQSSNEAAQTLLTIGSMTQLSNLSQSQMDTQDYITEETASSSAAQEENCDVVLAFNHGVFDTSEVVATEERGTTDGGDTAFIAISDQTSDGQKAVSDSEPSPKKDAPQARKGPLPEVKPKPNIGRGSGGALPKPQPDTSTPQTSEEAVNNQEDSSAVIEECAKDNLTEALPVSQEESACLAQSDQTTSESQSHGSSGASVSTNGSVHEGSQSSTTVISSVEEAQASQTEESDGKSGCQFTRRSGLQKVKLNLPQTSRSARSKPQTTKDFVEEDSKPVPVPRVEPEVPCSSSLEEPSHSTEEVMTGSVSQNQTLSESAVDPSKHSSESTSGSTDEKLAIESSGNLETSSQVVQVDAPPEESSDHPPAITPAEDPTVSQKEESSNASTTCQTRRGRVKPKPVLQQTSRLARVRPQSTKDFVEQDSKPVPSVKPEVTCSSPPKEPSPSTEEVTQSGSDQSVSPNQTLSESAVEPRKQESMSGSTDEKLESCGNLVTSDSVVLESQVVAPPEESSDHPPAITPAEDPTVSQKEESSNASTTCQTRRGRVKPKPVLQQTSRLARVRPQSTKDFVEQDSKPVPSVKPEVTCSSPPKEPSPSTEEVTQSGSDQSVSPNQTLSESAVEPRKQESMSGSTDEKLESCGNLVTSDSVVLESQVVAPPEETSDHPPAFTPAEDPTVSQKEESSVASNTCQTRRGRVKPKPVLEQTSRTARVRPQTTNESEKTIPLPTKEPPGRERTEDGLDQSIVEKQTKSSSEPGQEVTGSTCEYTDEKMETGGSENVVTLDLTPTEANVQHDIAAVEESKDTPVEDVTVSEKENSGVASPCQTKRGRSLKIKPKPNVAQTSRSARLKTQNINDSVEEDSRQTSHPKVEPSLACSSSPGETSHSAGPGSDGSPTSGTVQSRPPSAKDPVPSLIPGSTDTRKEVEAQPICGTTIAEVPGPSTGTASVAGPSLETCSTQKPTKGSVSTYVKSSSETSKPNLPLRRRPLPKVKPNLASLTRSPRAKLQPTSSSTSSCSDTSSKATSEWTSVDNSGIEMTNTEDNHKHLTTIQFPKNTALGKTNTASIEPGTIDACSDGNTVLETSCVAENQAVLTDLVSKMPERDVPAAPSDVQSPSADSIETITLSALDADVNIRTDPTESHAQPCSESTDSQLKSQETAFSIISSIRSPQSEPIPSAESPIKGPLGRRGRLIKPKPNLGRSVRPPQSQPIQNTTHAEPDSGSVQLQSVRKKPVEGAPESHANQKSPANDAGSSTPLMTQHDSSPVDAVSTPGCVTQEVHSSSHNTPTIGTEGTQSLSIFPYLSSEQLPSDPDEPFFILSLTEIPLSSSGNGIDSMAEPRPQLPVTDPPIPQQKLEPEPPSPLSSVPGESSAPAGDGCPSNVPLSIPVEEIGDRSIVEPRIKEEVMEKPSATQEQSNRPKSPKLLETEPNDGETEIPAAKQRAPGRRAKLQVKPNPTRTTRARQTVSPPASTSNQDSELPGPSSQPETSKAETASAADDAEPQTGSDDCGKMEIPAGGRSLRAKTRATKKKDMSAGKSSAPSSVLAPPRGKASSRSSKTPNTRTRLSPTPPPTSTSLDVAPTWQLKEPTHSTALTPSPTPAIISPSTSEVSTPQESNCEEISTGEVEEINVSQYFLSDIFTEVDET